MNFDNGEKLLLQSAEYDRSGVLELIESTNPVLAECVLHINDDISDRPGYAWNIESYWYVVETTASGDELSSWALFTISWDDNWECWQRIVEGGVSGSLTRDEAVRALMQKYYQDCNFDPDDHFWSSIFKPFFD